MVPDILGELTQIISHCKDKNVILIGDMNLCILDKLHESRWKTWLSKKNSFELVVAAGQRLTSNPHKESTYNIRARGYK